MTTTSELLATINKALDEVMAYVEIAVINYGDIDEQVPAAQSALAELRQRIADTERLLFYFLTRAEYEFKTADVIEYTLRDNIAKAKALLDD